MKHFGSILLVMTFVCSTAVVFGQQKPVGDHNVNSASAETIKETSVETKVVKKEQLTKAEAQPNRVEQVRVSASKKEAEAVRMKPQKAQHLINEDE